MASADKDKKAEETDELETLDALDKEASEYKKEAEIDRILKAFQLDAYAVLNLQPGIPDSQIKAQYKTLSLLIHPDKSSNPLAPSAFDRLKKAQVSLLDPSSRTHLDECIADARTLLLRERKLTVNAPEAKLMYEAGEMKDAWQKKTVEVLVEAEQRRRKQLKAQLQEEGREQRKVDEEIEGRKRKRDHEVAWEESREGRIGSWRDFVGGKAGGAAGGKTGGSGGKNSGEGSKKKKTKMKVLG